MSPVEVLWKSHAGNGDVRVTAAMRTGIAIIFLKREGIGEICIPRDFSSRHVSLLAVLYFFCYTGWAKKVGTDSWLQFCRISTDITTIYRVDQKSKLLILSEHVNKTEKRGGS